MRLATRRARLKLTRGKITKMSQERQKLSFFIVVIFLAVFGLIVLAEVFFMDPREGGGIGNNGGDGYSSFFDDSIAWETPKPLLPEPEFERREPLGLARNERFQKSIRRHEDEMEQLIKNIQSSVAAQAAAHKIPLKKKPPASPGGKKTFTPHGYAAWEVPADLDFGLGRHHGHDAVWQPVNGTKHKFYVYSAYFDARLGRKIVRVIAATRTKSPDKVWCKFHTTGSDSPSPILPASVTVIRENWNLKYSAVFVICPLPPPMAGAPSASVSASAEDSVPPSLSVIASDNDTNTPPANQLPVLNTRVGNSNVESGSLGVCVKPIHFSFSKTLELVEFIELNRLLGVSHFTFYNDTMSPEVSCLLRRYEAQGLVEVLPWKLNMRSQTEIRTEGLFAALNDCLYRNMYKFQYLMLIDFDEFVIPRHNRTIPEMLHFVDEQKAKGAIASSGGGSPSLSRIKSSKLSNQLQRTTSSYSFQNAFFYLQFGDDDEAGTSDLRVLRKTRRKSKFNPQKQRSKYICIPRNVKEAGNHFIWEFVEGYNLNVPTSVGFLHHYRVCEFGGDDCVQTESVVDRTVYRYREDLVANVDKVIGGLSAECQLRHQTTTASAGKLPPQQQKKEEKGETMKAAAAEVVAKKKRS